MNECFFARHFIMRNVNEKRGKMPIYIERLYLMKKPIKNIKKTNSRGKTTQNIRKKAVKSPEKRKKAGYSDGLRAFLLAGVIVIFSICISLAVISIHSALNKTPAVSQDVELNQTLTNGNDTQPVSIEPQKNESIQPPVNHGEDPPRPPSNGEGRRSPPGPASAVTSAPVTNTAPASVQKPPERSVQNLGTLVFVIDDAGNNLRELEPFLRISYPLTIAVLPGLPYSAEAARRIRAAGKEVILHQPMEAIGAQNPGPGAIYSGMSADEIRAVLSRNIAEVGPVAGINNHQGSKVTMDREAMQTILAFCAEHDLYFLDSRTTAETVVPSVARNMGMRIAERNVFLDNEQNRESMLGYISNGLTRAQREGSAVMIGHTWSPQLAPLLAEQFPLLTSQGYTIKTASDIIEK
jgi:polysaccharide deacetylase 2 family uncharacterized protein YibQ